MKRRDFIKKLENAGFYLKAHGGNHDTYIRGQGEIEQIPRHKEIKESLAKSIIKRWGLE